jgi:hypothetical protein
MGMSQSERSRAYRLRHPDRVKATKSAHRDRNREKIRAADRLNATSSRAKRRVWLDAYKVAAGCTDCGYNTHPRALDFDHIGSDKSGDVGRLAHHRIAWDRLMAEIAKCEVVCANCHRVRTWRREQGQTPKPPSRAPDDAQLDLFGEASA